MTYSELRSDHLSRYQTRNGGFRTQRDIDTANDVFRSVVMNVDHHFPEINNARSRKKQQRIITKYVRRDVLGFWGSIFGAFSPIIMAMITELVRIFLEWMMGNLFRSSSDDEIRGTIHQLAWESRHAE